jgi:hypothetical protein
VMIVAVGCVDGRDNLHLAIESDLR